MGQALPECEGYAIILTKALKALIYLGPPSRAKPHSFGQETTLAMSAMSLVSSLLLHFSSRINLSCVLIWSLICLGDGLHSLLVTELDAKSKLVNLTSKNSSSSRHSRMRQTDSISSERANKILELSVSAWPAEESSVIRHRKQSFLVKQRACAEGQSITIIDAVLEYHFQNSLTELPKKGVQNP